jgi:hypothetical protein
LKQIKNNLDKTIQDLINRLDEIHTYSSNHENKNDGITYWKGKRIILVKEWNELYEKSSIYTNAYTTTLTSRKILQYFPDDYNGSISASGIVVDEKLKEEIKNWNKDYYAFLEYRKNPTLGRMKCSKCLLSGSNDDPIFVGIEKVFARIVSNQCNKNNAANNHSDRIITYHCSILNIFSCPFESKEESYHSFTNRKVEKAKHPYKREDLFTLHQISFAIEQVISTFFEITKNNEIIFEVDFLNDRVQEIHTNYNGEPESWGWQENVKEQLPKVKPISNIVIRDENDIYNILTNREKLECLLQEYEIYFQLDREVELPVCYDENTPYVPTNDDENNEKGNSSNEKKMMIVDASNYNNNDYKDSYKEENSHSKNTEDKGLDIEYFKPDLNSKIKEELEKSHREQQILLKENKQTIVDFLLDSKESIRIEDLKIYEPIYKCYRQKGNCLICNTLCNIICKNSHNNKEVWLCTNHWQEHALEHH